MKKPLFVTGLLVCILIFAAGIAQAQTVSIDYAIRSATEEFSNNLKSGSKIAIISMRASSARMSNYLFEELTSSIVGRRIFTVVDRAQLALIREEMNFQMSGEVNEESAQAIGQKLGAQYIITGTFEPVGNYYRFRVRVIEVETAIIQVTYSANVQNDRVVASLLAGGDSTIASTPNTPSTRTAQPQQPSANTPQTDSSTSTQQTVVFFDDPFKIQGLRWVYNNEKFMPFSRQMKNVYMEYDDTYQHYLSASKKITAGWVCIGLSLAGLVVMFVGMPDMIENNNPGLYLGGAGGALVFSITSLPLSFSASKSLTQAFESYNTNARNKARQQRQQP
ncbi:MAG: penicillin-binding protein activator LpoB [Treponema sp.]|nr:penicillin-binding protein activator LpoB [Treponema sp.]